MKQYLRSHKNFEKIKQRLKNRISTLREEFRRFERTRQRSASSCTKLRHFAADEELLLDGEEEGVVKTFQRKPSILSLDI